MLFNWADFLFIAIIFWCLYWARKSDMISEFFKLAASVLSTVLTFHYYVALDNILKNRLFFPKEFPLVFAFLFLVLWLYFIFALLKEGWKLILQVKVPKVLDVPFAIIFASVRSVIFCSLVLAAMILSPKAFLINGAMQSFSGRYVKSIAPAIYRTAYDGLIKEIFPQEPPRTEIFKMLAEEPPQEEDAPPQGN